jgi:hypothetical protein
MGLVAMNEARQLHLFKSKRQRGVRPPPPREFSLHVAFADALRVGIDKHWRYSHIASGEYRTDATAGRLRRMGVTRGMPDFIFFGPRGFAFIELKRPGGRMSPEQVDMMSRLAAAGASVLCTDNLGDALAFLRDLGAVRTTVMA